MIKIFTTTAKQRKEIIDNAKTWIEILLDDNRTTGDDSLWFNAETKTFYIGMAGFWIEDTDPQSFNLCQIINGDETKDDLILQVINSLIRFNGHAYSTKKNFYEAFSEVEEYEERNELEFLFS